MTTLNTFDEREIVAGRQRSEPDEIGNPEIGARLAKFRKAAGVSQYELAVNLGVTQPLISRFEKGERRMYDDLLSATAKLLGVTPNDLLGFGPSKPISPEISKFSRRLIKQMKRIESLPRRAQDKVIASLELALKCASD